MSASKEQCQISSKPNPFKTSEEIFQHRDPQNNRETGIRMRPKINQDPSKRTIRR